MYSLKVTNNYFKTIESGPSKIAVNETVFYQDANIEDDTFTIVIPQMGNLFFRFLGEQKIPGYNFITEKYGVLIRMKTTEAYYRFDNNGALELVVDNFGTCTLSANNGSFLEIKLPELIISN